MRYYVIILFVFSLPWVAQSDVSPPYESNDVGVELNEADGSPEVISVIKGSPAAVAGVKRGDRLIAVDGTYPKAVPHYFLERSVSAEKGTKVELVLLRDARRVISVNVSRSLRPR